MRWTEEAASRLLEIHQYIAERSPEAAQRTAAGLYELGASLQRFPERGFLYTTRSGRSVRVVLHGHYRVVYGVREDGDVLILGVFHGAMDLGRYLP